MDVALYLQLLANGLCVGLAYGLAAVGLALLFGVLEQVNFAHGEIYMLAAFTLWTLTQILGMSYWIAIPAVVALMAGAGFLLAVTAILPTIERSFETAILATLAVSMILQNAARLVFGATPLHVAAPLEGDVLDVAGVLFFAQRLFASMIGLIAVGLLIVFLRYTETGRAMRAMAQNRDACLMVGIDVRRITTISTMLAAALCGLAAVAIAPQFDLYPNMGADFTFKGFAVIIMGGMGNIAGAMVAGLILGIAESFAGGLVGTVVRDGIGFCLMIGMLLLRPQGLFGASVRV